MYLGIDLGTSAVKTVLIDENQRVVGHTSEPLAVDHAHSGWSEQDPASWVSATTRAINALRYDLGDELAALRAIGLSGQMHGATLLDEADKVLRPCILWNDTRSHIEAAQLDSIPAFRSITGNIVFPGFTAPKLQWVKKHEPEVFKRTAKVLLPKDFIRLWLSGEHISDMSDASGTSWLNVAKREWSTELLDACELSTSHMPSLVEGSEPGGYLRKELAEAWGISNQVVIAGGAGDNAASAIATGTIKPGSATVSLGSSGTIFAANDAYLPNPDSAVHAFCHALPERWHQMGVMLSATSALDWFGRIVDMEPQALTSELPQQLSEPNDVYFLPYLAGERTPHNDALVRGSFHGLSTEHTRVDMTRAVLEGVAFALRDNLEAIKLAGTSINELTIVGGGSRSQYWLELIATALGAAIKVPEEGDFGAGFGAARLAMLSVNDVSAEQVCTAAGCKQIVEPNTLLTDAYHSKYLKFRSLYSKPSSAT